MIQSIRMNEAFMCVWLDTYCVHSTSARKNAARGPNAHSTHSAAAPMNTRSIEASASIPP
jgi:hypothetical protein